MTMMIQDKDDPTVQCIVCVHRPICCSVLKNVTTYPPPHPYISEMAFFHRFPKIYTPPPRCDTPNSHQTMMMYNP